MAFIRRRVLGLDLGSHSVKAVALHQTLRGFEISQLQTMPTLDAGDPRDFGERLRSFAQTFDLPTEYVVTAIPGDRLTSRRMSFPFRDRRKLTQAVAFAIEDELPFDLGGMIFDWEFLSGSRAETEVVASIVPREEVARTVELLDAAAYTTRVLEAEGLCLGNLPAWFDLAGVRLLLDLGHRKTTLCLCVEGRPIAARTIPVGGRSLTDAVAKARGLTSEAAERLKCEQGILRGDLGSDLDEPARVLDRLAREIVRTLGTFEPLLAERRIERVDAIVMMGGTAKLPHLDSYLSERTGIQAVPLAVPQTPEGANFLAGGDPLVFGPAASLAVRGLASPHTRTNFRQDEFAVRFDMGQLGRDLAWTGGLAGLALILAATSAGTSIVLDSKRADAAEQEIARLYSDVVPGAAPSNVLAAMRNEVRSTHDRASFLGVYGGSFSALDLLTQISARVPKNIKVVFEELSIDGQLIRIRGHTDSFEAVDRLRAELAREPVFSLIKVSEIQSDERRNVKSFSLTISLAGGEESG